MLNQRPGVIAVGGSSHSQLWQWTEAETTVTNLATSGYSSIEPDLSKAHDSLPEGGSDAREAELKSATTLSSGYVIHANYQAKIGAALQPLYLDDWTPRLDFIRQAARRARGRCSATQTH